MESLNSRNWKRVRYEDDDNEEVASGSSKSSTSGKSSKGDETQGNGRMRKYEPFKRKDEDGKKRLNPRLRKIIRCFKDDHDDDNYDDDRDEGDSVWTAPASWHLPVSHPSCSYLEKTDLDFQDPSVIPVTCGNKNGSLDKAKFAQGEACIESEGCWFAPPAFEHYGGRGYSKKWKTTIFHEDVPLGELIELGYLTTPGFKKKKPEPKIPSPDSAPENSSEESSTEEDGGDSCHSSHSFSTEEEDEHCEEDGIKDDSEVKKGQPGAVKETEV